MTKEEFDSQVEVADTVKLPYFKAKPHRNLMEETSQRVRAIGGVVPNMVIYGAYLFMESHTNAISQFGRNTLPYSEAVNISRQGVNRADYAAKTNKLPIL